VDTDLTETDMLAMASSFDVIFDQSNKKFVRVELRANPHGGRDWVIVNDTKFMLNRDGIWEWPPILGIDDDFLARTRWDDAHSAIQAARVVNGSTPQIGVPAMPPDTQKPDNSQA
jgi:hypothetical protein